MACLALLGAVVAMCGWSYIYVRSDVHRRRLAECCPSSSGSLWALAEQEKSDLISHLKHPSAGKYQEVESMADREQKKFERNLGKASDLRDARVRNAVELRKSAQDERLKKGRGVTESSSPLAVVQPTAGMGMPGSADALGFNANGAVAAAAAAPPRPQPSVSEIPSLFANIQSHDPAVVLEATRGFRRLLSLQKDPPITEVVETGVVPIFVSFLQHDRMPDLQFEAAWALTNVASGTSTHTRSVTEAGAIPVFVRLLQSVNENVKEQAVWALGNIAGDSVSCRDAVLAQNAMAPLLSVLETTGTNKQSLLRNATWTLSNFCRGKPAPDLDLIAPALPTMARLVLCQDSEVLSDVCWAMSYLSDGDERRIDALLRNVPIEYNLPAPLLEPHFSF